MKKYLIVIIFSFLISETSFAKCKKEDFKNYVNTSKGCIGIDYFEFKKYPEKDKKKIVK